MRRGAHDFIFAVIVFRFFCYNAVWRWPAPLVLVVGDVMLAKKYMLSRP